MADFSDFYPPHAEGITEAPIDGTKYARMDADWVSIVEGGGGGLTYESVAVDTVAVANSGYLVDSASGPITITLPAGVDNDVVTVRGSGNAETNNVIIVPDGTDTIMGDAEGFTLNVNWQGIKLVKLGTDWEFVKGIGEGSGGGGSDGGGVGLTYQETSGDFDAAVSNGYFIDTSVGPSIAQLPPGSNNDRAFFADNSGEAGNNNITIMPNGTDTIMGLPFFVLNSGYQHVEITKVGTDWKFTSALGESDGGGADPALDYVWTGKHTHMVVGPDSNVELTNNETTQKQSSVYNTFHSPVPALFGTTFRNQADDVELAGFKFRQTVIDAPEAIITVGEHTWEFDTIGSFIANNYIYGKPAGSSPTDEVAVLAERMHGAGQGIYFNDATWDLNTLVGGEYGWAQGSVLNPPPGGTASFIETQAQFGSLTRAEQDRLQVAWPTRGSSHISFRNFDSNLGTWTGWHTLATNAAVDDLQAQLDVKQADLDAKQITIDELLARVAALEAV